MNEPVFLDRTRHPISRKDIDKGVLHILYTLKEARFRGTLVGGCIRDMLCGLSPKDFDIATDAPPEKIRRLFRRCYIIGRRFRLAHVYTGKDDFVEVATYRGPVDDQASENQNHPQANNTYGTIAEDALRRDFTINALYYDIDGFAIIDYVGGLRDIEEKVVRMIGNPRQRLLEDPVRIIRAVKYAAKLGFAIEDELLGECRSLVSELATTNAVRRLEELYKILGGGYSAAVFEQLNAIGAIHALAPQMTIDMDMLARRLAVIDEAIAEGYSFSRGVLMAVLYYDRILDALSAKEEQLGRRIDPVIFFADEFTPIAIDINLPRVEREVMRAALAQQSRLFDPHGRKFNKKRLIFSRSFKDAFDLFEIVARARGGCEELLEYWKGLVEEYGPLPDHSQKPKSVAKGEGRRRRPRRRRGGRKSS